MSRRLRFISLVFAAAVPMVGLSTGVAGATYDYPDNSYPPPVTVPGDEGCTPGYWKNHLSSWQGYSPTQKVSSVFTGAGTYANVQLKDALALGGGSGVDGAKRILLRAATAALLNASHSGVDGFYSVKQVVDQVNAALRTNNRQTILNLAAALDRANNLGCPLN